ncbi:PTS system, mannitol-specific IIC component [Alteribacillus persepolensis]|uniref:PTS system mannitol-specific EIICB component n=1 Tax=Alteribacillus persepolensis TaxID=568899 RepID=A0A1G8GBV9_9BACI|nr:PTS mannitol transporter subunit IICB [Alteribacillus persepolensis]SDH91800.1 PTS system, mannitol-specific IIC component [Alteribacillus persepolensis]
MSAEQTEKAASGTFRAKLQRFGSYLSGMIMPNIGAFIAWGIITALFIEDGWAPNEDLAGLVDPMINYLLPLLIGYTGGKMIYEARGGVVGAIATMGVIVGADIPMFLGAMVMGPLAGYIIKKFDEAMEGKVRQGFEMLVNNFSSGIIGGLLTVLGLYAVGPFVEGFNNILAAGVDVIVQAGLLPLASIFIEPAKVLFLNNAINHGILTPLGANESTETGKSILFMLETNPGPGLGVLLAYMFFGQGMSKSSAPGAAIIHFFGGIHEIYFPYILMKPQLLLAVIAGGMSGIFTFVLFDAGLRAAPSPGSIIAYVAMTLPGDYIGMFAGVLIAAIVSFVVAAIILRFTKDKQEDLSGAAEKMQEMKGKESKAASNLVEEKQPEEEAQETAYDKNIDKVVFACDAGMGSSAMGASVLKQKVKKAGLDIEVTNTSINQIPEDADLVVTHKDLTERAQAKHPDAEHVSVDNFLNSGKYDELVESWKDE